MSQLLARDRSFHEAVWNGRRGQDVVMIKTLLYSGVRVSELVRIRLGDVDLDGCRIRVEHGKGKKDRYVPFPSTFKETLALHIDAQRQAGASDLFESSWKKPLLRPRRAGRSRLERTVDCRPEGGEVYAGCPQRRCHGTEPRAD